MSIPVVYSNSLIMHMNDFIDNKSTDALLSGLDPDLEAWSKYNEDLELEAKLSVDERLKEFDIMMDSVDFKALWDVHQSRVIYLLKNSTNKSIEGAETLSDQDMDDIRAFKLYMVSNMPRRAFNQMRYAFKHKMEISSLYIITHKLAILSGTTPVWYDCCLNSCIAYTGDYKNNQQCPKCSEPRFTQSQPQQPWQVFCYVPLIP